MYTGGMENMTLIIISLASIIVSIANITFCILIARR